MIACIVTVFVPDGTMMDCEVPAGPDGITVTVVESFPVPVPVPVADAVAVGGTLLEAFVAASLSPL